MADLVSPWHPTTESIDLKHLGKLSEELGECQAAVARCIIQGINECEPVSLKDNKNWLEEELADVIANIHLNILHFKLNDKFIRERAEKKIKLLSEWHSKA